MRSIPAVPFGSTREHLGCCGSMSFMIERFQNDAVYGDSYNKHPVAEKIRLVIKKF